jgi:type I restriction enzyme S subunit
VLSSLDDKIDLLHRQNKTLEALAETLFRQWFIEEADESWETYKLKELVKHVKPGTNFQPKRIEVGIPFINVRNLNNGFLDLTDTTKISKEEYLRVHKSWEPEENDVLISRIGTLGVVAVIQKCDLPVAVHYNMINLRAKLTSYQFLYFLVKSQLFSQPLNYINILIVNNLINKNAVFFCKFCIFKV